MVNLALLLISTAFAAPAPLTLSQKDVAELVLKQGPSAKEVTYKYEQNLYNFVLTKAVYDWKMQVETGYQSDRNESLQNYLVDYKKQNYITTVGLQKELIVGTILTAEVGRNAQKSDQITGTTTPPDAVADYYQLGLEHPLWGNFSGAADRAQVNAAEATYRSTVTLRANELEDVVMTALRQYWTTYVAQENFRQSLAARDRYDKLVAAVRRRASASYANPGELAQAQAEYEGRVQKVKTASKDYLASLDSLLTLLSLDHGTEIAFNVPKDLPPVPKLDDKPVEQLRAIRSQELKIKAAEETLNYVESNDQPRFNLVARLRVTGVDETTESSYAELSSGSHPQSYIGVKFQYAFGSGSQSEDQRAHRAALALEETKLSRLRSEERDKAIAAERNVGTAYAIAESALRQRGFRERAMQELNRTYTQGRTSLKDLIDAMNSYFDSQVQVLRTIGDYQIALNEWAAARDELIPEQKEGTP